MLDMTDEEAKYITTYYRKYGDQKLARALGRKKSWIKAARKELDCFRSKEDMGYIRTHPKAYPPPLQTTSQQPYIPVSRALSRKQHLILGLTFIIPFFFYIITLSPTPVGAKGAELAISVKTLGLPSSPACPAYLLLAHLFTLLPIGEEAVRLNLFSALFGAMTSWIVALIVVKLFRSLFAGIFLGLAFAFSTSFWQFSVTTSPVTFASCMSAFMFMFFLSWHEHKQEKSLIMATFFFGLAVTSYSLFFLMLPAIFVFLWIVLRERETESGLLPCISILTILCLSIFLYLPLRSWSDPVFDRAQLTGIKDTLTYIFGVFHNPYGEPAAISTIAKNFFYHLDAICQSLLPTFAHATIQISLTIALVLCVLFALFFGYLNLWYQRKALFCSGLVLSISIIAALAYFSVGVCEHITIFFVALLGTLLIGIGKPVAQLFEQRKIVGKFMLSIAACSFLLMQIITHWNSASYRQWNFPKIYATSILNATEANAVIIPHDNLATLYLLYQQQTLGHYSQRHIIDVYKTDQEFSKLRHEELLDAVQQKYPNRPLYLTFVSSQQKWSRYFAQRTTLAWRVSSFSYGRLPSQKTYKFLDLPPQADHFSRPESKLLSLAHFIQGCTALEREEITKALFSFDNAPHHSFEATSFLFKKASSLVSRKKYRRALKLYEKLADKEADSKVYLVMARIKTKLGQTAAAQLLYAKVLQENPDHFQALHELAYLHEKNQEFAKAQQLYEHLIGHYPNNPIAYTRLANILVRDPLQRERVKQLRNTAQQLEKKRISRKSPRLPDTHKAKPYRVPGIPSPPQARPIVPQLYRPTPKIPFTSQPTLPKKTNPNKSQKR